MDYQAVLVVSFGGPEGPDEVLPFLENVLRGKNVPRQRMMEVARHYQQFGGVSPINSQNRALISALQTELEAKGPALPIYWGNRNWHPLLADTLRNMKDDGIKRALAFFTSAYSSYSGCRQYREDIQKAREIVGAGAPEVDKLRAFYNHPGFVEPNLDHLKQALDKVPEARRARAEVVFTAHSIPLSMAGGCRYEEQLREACRLVAEGVNHPSWALVYQSRSGPPSQPWLEPDVCDYLRQRRQEGLEDAVLLPIGFISDHMEILFDLDTEARQVAEEIGLQVHRAATVGTNPSFVKMIGELIRERTSDDTQRRFLGSYGPSHDVCPPNCCRYQPAR